MNIFDHRIRDDAISPFDGVMLRILVSVGFAAADTLFCREHMHGFRSFSSSWRPGLTEGVKRE